MVSTVGLLGAAWGSAALLIYPEAFSLRVLLGACILAVLSSVGLGTLLLRPAFFALALPAMGPIFVRLATSGEASQFASAAVLAACTATLVLHFVESNEASVVLVRNRIENALLGNRVERLKGRIAATEEELEVAYRTLDEHRNGLGIAPAPVERAAVLTRPDFNARLSETWAATSRETESFSVALVEISDYPHLLAENGEETVGRLFHELGRFIGSCLRTEDCIAGFAAPRYGIVLRDSDSETASRALERIRRRVESTPIDVGQPILCNLTMGVASFEEGVRPMEMIGRAERALAQAWTTNDRLRAWEFLDGAGKGTTPARFTISGTTPREIPATLPPR